jgi:hypothetical protein
MLKEGWRMNNLDLTRWLLKVRNALAEQDEIKRNSMLLAADRFLKRTNQQSLVFGRTRNRRDREGKKPGQLVQPKQVVETCARN